MLRELLELIASGRGGTVEGIARALGLSASEIGDMLSRLRSLGYIEDFAASCASSCADGDEKKRSACAGCSMSAACNFGAKAHVWILSEKGKAALKS
jgi:DNA-binding Lrp family transcriptional regulator